MVPDGVPNGLSEGVQQGLRDGVLEVLLKGLRWVLLAGILMGLLFVFLIEMPVKLLNAELAPSPTRQREGFPKESLNETAFTVPWQVGPAQLHQRNDRLVFTVP